MKKRYGISLGLMAMIIVMAIVGISYGEEKSPPRIESRTLNRFLENRESVMVVNVASYLECQDARIPASQCMPCDQDKDKPDLFPGNKETKLIFYGGSAPVEANCRVIEEAMRQGFTRIYVLKGGLPAWKRAGYDTESAQRIPRTPGFSVYPRDVGAWQKQAKKPLVLDIRSPELFKNHHMEGALNIPMSVLHLRYQEIPLDRSLLVVDEEGSRGFLAASYLSRKGFAKIGRLTGGMAAWDAYIKRGSPR